MWTKAFIAVAVGLAIAFPCAYTLTLGQGSKDMYQNTMDMPESCVNAPPVQSNYTPKGRTFTLSDSEIPDILLYETGNLTSSKIAIAAYDIFGFSENQTKQVADIIAAELNIRVVMPDFFRGSAFSKANPMPTQEEIARFVGVHGDWEDSVRPDTEAVIRYYKQTANATSFGFFGWCWGGKVAAQASIFIDEVVVSGLIHPGGLVLDEAAQVKCPMYLMPGSNDADLIPFYEVLQQNFGVLNSGHRRFELAHGFAGGRSDFSNGTIIAAVDEVVTIITEFFGPRLN